MKLGLDKMSTGFKIVMGGLLLLVLFFVGYAIYDQIGFRRNYKVVKSEEKDIETRRERTLKDLIEESKAAKLREEKKKEKALDELIKENKKIDFSKHARSRNSQNQKSKNHDISEKINMAKREIENRSDVIEADIAKKSDTISIAIVIPDYSERGAKEIGEACLRLAITFIDKENPGSQYIGYTEFAYLIGVYLQDGTRLAFGAKAESSRALVW